MDNKHALLSAISSIASLIGHKGRKAAESAQEHLEDVAPGVRAGMDTVADYLTGPQMRNFLDQAEDFSVRRPAVFVCGAFLLGFAASRFLRSGPGNGHKWAESDAGYQDTGVGL